MFQAQRLWYTHRESMIMCTQVLMYLYQINSNWFLFIIGLTSAEQGKVLSKQKSILPFSKMFQLSINPKRQRSIYLEIFCSFSLYVYTTISMVPSHTTSYNQSEECIISANVLTLCYNLFIDNMFKIHFWLCTICDLFLLSLDEFLGKMFLNSQAVLGALQESVGFNSYVTILEQ